MAEVKHYYFDSATHGDGIRLNQLSAGSGFPTAAVQNKGLMYIPKDSPEYKVLIAEDNSIYATNFLKVFDPERIFPSQRGTSSVDTIIGSKFKWLNTMIDLEINSAGLLNLYRLPCDTVVSATTFPIFTSSSARTTSTTKSSYALDVTQLQGRLLTASAGVGTPVTLTPNSVSTSLPVSEISQTPATKDYTDLQSALVVSTSGREAVAVSTTNAPLFMSPAFKPYYYCRFVVLRMNISVSDYLALKDNPYSWRNFFNGLWWDRNFTTSSAAPQRHMSQRVNDYNVTNPFGGMFDVVYNKKLKINPFKVFRLRYNLKSSRKGGDLITIKSANPLMPITGESFMYNNGNYFGFLLSPLSLGDFDPITQQYIMSQSVWKPDERITSTSQQQTFHRADGGIVKAWVEPAEVLNGYSYPTILNCAKSTLFARTAYLD